MSLKSKCCGADIYHICSKCDGGCDELYKDIKIPKDFFNGLEIDVKPVFKRLSEIEEAVANDNSPEAENYGVKVKPGETIKKGMETIREKGTITETAKLGVPNTQPQITKLSTTYKISHKGIEIKAEKDEDGRLTIYPNNSIQFDNDGFVFIGSKPKTVREIGEILIKCSEL